MMKSRLLTQSLCFLQKNESSDLLQPVVIRNEAVPSFFIIFAGEPHPRKKACFNSITKDWMLNGDALTKVDVKEDECPYLKLSTFITHMKGLASELQSYNNHFNIESGFD